MGKLARLKKKLNKLSREYDKFEGQPLRQKRILKSAEATQRKIEERTR
jgi:hypothetical protein